MSQSMSQSIPQSTVNTVDFQEERSNFSEFDPSKSTFGKTVAGLLFYPVKTYENNGPTNFASVDPSTFSKKDKSFKF